MSEQKNSVIIKSFNTFGIGENITTVTFPSNDKGKNDDSGYELKRQVERQKVYLWLIFALLPTSVYLIVSKLRNGEKVWKALLGSNILGIVPPLILLMYSLDRIQYLIS